MGIDKDPGGNIHKIEKPRQVGDRVVIKKDAWEKYVRAVEVPEADVDAWRESRKAASEGLPEEQIKDADDRFLDTVPHPKGEVVTAPQLFIVEKIPGKYKVAPLMSSERFVWVDSNDVEDRPFHT